MPAELIKVKKYKGVYYRISKKEVKETDPDTGETIKKKVVHKRHLGKPDRCFYAAYRNAAGKFKFEKMGWASEGYNAQLAAQVRAERIRTIRHGKELPNPKKVEMTFGEAWKKYDEWLDTGKKSFYDDRNRYNNHIKNRFASKGLSEIKAGDLEKFKDALLRKGLAPQTVKHVLVIIRQVYNKMKAWEEWSGPNPIKGVKMPKINNKRVRFLTHQEADNLLGAVKKKSVQVWEYSLLSLQTGMRADECLSLLWGHLNFEQNMIHVADPKGGPARDVYMTKKVREMLKAKKEGEKADLVFRARHGGKSPEVSKTFLRTVTDLGLNKGIKDRRQLVSFHTLRHTFASWLAIQGTPLIEIRDLLGHASLAMTERYAHLIPDQKRESVRRMEEAFEEANGEKEES